MRVPADQGGLQDCQVCETTAGVRGGLDGCRIVVFPRLEHATLPHQKCIERITAKGSGECEPYYFDLLKCVDKCVSATIMLTRRACSKIGILPQAAPQIFKLLK